MKQRKHAFTSRVPKGFSKILLIISILFISANSVQSQYGFDIRGNFRRVIVPFEIYNNLIVIPIYINNKIPLKFVVDTGVQSAILTEKSFTDILGTDYVREFVIRGVGGVELLRAYLANDIGLTIPGGINSAKQPLIVLKEDYINLRNYLGEEVHGLIGYELFSRFVVEIDYGRQQLVFHKTESFRPGWRYEEVDISIEGTKPFIYDSIKQLDGSSIYTKLLVDTGAGHGIMLDPQSSDLITIPEKTIDANIGRGLGGEIDGQIGRLESLKFGGYVLEDPIATYPYPNSYLDSLLGDMTYRNGSLGGEVLSRFNIIFDYSSSKMYVRKNSQFKKSFYYNLSGMTVKAIGSKLNTFEISEVRPSSNAYKVGVKAGDRIITVNGISTESMNLSQLTSILSSRPDRNIRLTLLREEEELKVKIRLESSI